MVVYFPSWVVKKDAEVVPFGVFLVFVAEETFCSIHETTHWVIFAIAATHEHCGKFGSMFFNEIGDFVGSCIVDASFLFEKIDELIHFDN